MRKLASVLLLCLAAPAFALDVAGTTPAAVKGAAKADFSFGPVAVKGVAWDRGAVVMPQTDVKGRKYSDIKLLSKALYGKLETCFRSGCSPLKPASAPKIKVAALKPLKSKVRVANAEVWLDGDLLVVAGVMVSSREPGTFWVAFPPELGFTDGSFKAAVESAVIAAWTKKK